MPEQATGRARERSTRKDYKHTTNRSTGPSTTQRGCPQLLAGRDILDWRGEIQDHAVVQRVPAFGSSARRHARTWR
jgi:hypothetical protein